VFQGDYNLDALTGDQPFHLLANRYKGMAAESTAHGHVSSTLHLVKTHDLKAEDIASVRVRAGTRAIAHTGDAAKRHPVDKETADHSSWYLTAMAILEREVGPRQYAKEKYTDPKVEALMSRITLEVSKEFDAYPMGGEVEIETRGGKKLTHRVLHPKGTKQNPLSDEELNAKFRDMASMYMSAGAIDRLLEALWNIGTCKDVATLMPLLVWKNA
jgi:2-methylcitrate dehydratase